MTQLSLDRVNLDPKKIQETVAAMNLPQCQPRTHLDQDDLVRWENEIRMHKERAESIAQVIASDDHDLLVIDQKIKILNGKINTCESQKGQPSLIVAQALDTAHESLNKLREHRQRVQDHRDQKEKILLATNKLKSDLEGDQAYQQLRQERDLIAAVR